jgi:hypothetical protein
MKYLNLFIYNFKQVVFSFLSLKVCNKREIFFGTEYSLLNKKYFFFKCQSNLTFYCWINNAKVSLHSWHLTS